MRQAALTALLNASMKRCAFAALCCGVMATLTLPPVFVFPLLIPAFSGLFLLLNAVQNGRQSFWIGWWFGLGYFVSGLYWFAYSLLVDAEKFAWMIPFAVLGLPSILAIYYGLAGLAYRYLRRFIPHPLMQAVAFAALWLLIELARGYFFTGFPWNLIAMSWNFSLPMLQSVSLIGSYGLSSWTVLLAVLPAVALLSQQQRNTALSLALLMLLLPFGYGVYQLENHPTRYTDVTLKLVQPSIPQQMKMREDQRVAMVHKHVEMSRPRAGESQADLVIWSETAYPFLVQSFAPPLKFIAAEVLGNTGIFYSNRARRGGEAVGFGEDSPTSEAQKYVVTGGVRINGERITNSLNVIGADASVVQSYDKVKLVPFGEFMPLRRWLPVAIESVAQGMQDFTAGEHGQQITLKNLPPFLPLICYEVIFPEMAASNAKHRPAWLLNITNDGWFGASSGPYQHFEMARLRAVEQGLPLVRVANNGITAIIDGQGRVLQQLPLNAEGVLVGRLPQARDAKP